MVRDFWHYWPERQETSEDLELDTRQVTISRAISAPSISIADDKTSTSRFKNWCKSILKNRGEKRRKETPDEKFKAELNEKMLRKQEETEQKLEDLNADLLIHKQRVFLDVATRFGSVNNLNVGQFRPAHSVYRIEELD